MKPSIRQQMRVLAEATHEKCEDGTHWNNKKNKCMPLDKFTSGLSKEAHGLSATAHSTSADKGKSNLDKLSAQNDAHARHTAAAARASAVGFGDLAKQHNDLAAGHHAKAKEHHGDIERHKAGASNLPFKPKQHMGDSVEPTHHFVTSPDGRPGLRIVRESDHDISDEELAVLSIFDMNKPGYRVHEMERAGLGKYEPANPTIQALVKRGLIKVMANNAMQLDKPKAQALMKQHHVPEKYKNHLSNTSMQFKSKHEESALPEAHERCEDGTHWNSKERKCMPLPDDLHGAVRHAKYYTKAAKTQTDKAGPGQHNINALNTHEYAAKAHQSASDQAMKAGFDTVANAHRNMARKHVRLAKSHGVKQPQP